MNYVKIIQGKASKTPETSHYFFEHLANEFLKGIHEQGHRVMSVKYHVSDTQWITAIFTLNDEPHPHAKKKTHEIKKLGD